MQQDLTFKQANISSSAILSAVTGEVRRWWLNQFPENYFKYIRITSGGTIPDIEGDADRMRAYRKSNPCLALRPRLKFQEDLMGEALRNPAPFLYENIGPDSHYYTLYRNDQFLQRITFMVDYYKMEFQVGIRVESEVQMLDVIGLLNKRIFPENYFYINDCPLLVEIPSNLLFKTAEDLGLNLYKPEDVKIFLDILQHNTTYPIDIKIKKDSGKKIIAFIMPANILCRVEKLPEPDVQHVNRSIDNTKIQFTMTAQVPFPNLFKMWTELPVPMPPGWSRPDDGDPNKPEPPFETSGLDNGRLMINYALTTEPPQYIKGTSAKRIFMKKFITGTDMAVDYLSLAGILPPALEMFIDQMLEEHKKDVLEEAILFRLYRDEYCEPPTNYKFDFKNKTLELFSPLRNYIYRVVIYVETTILQRYEAIIRGIPDLQQVFDADILQ